MCGPGGGASRYRKVRQLYTGLSSSGAVNLQHGLLMDNGAQPPRGATPIEVNLDPASNQNYWFAQTPGWDSEYIYLFVGGLSGGDSHAVFVTITF
jgi:hypothetical protein